MKARGEASHYDDSSIKLAPFPSTVGHRLTLIFVTTLPVVMIQGFFFHVARDSQARTSAALYHWNHYRLFHW